MHMIINLIPIVLKSLFILLIMASLGSSVSLAHAQFQDLSCPSCLEIPDQETLDLYKQELPLVIWAQDILPGSTTIALKGQSNLGSSLTPVIITVVNPIGNIVTVDQIMTNADGSFESDIRTGGPLWKQDGPYIIKAQQGDGTAGNRVVKIQVDIVDGAIVPEFGSIASLVLLVAITSIIIITAKSRTLISTKI